MPLAARLLGLLLYLVTVTVAISLTVLCMAGVRFLILRELVANCGP